MNGLPERMPSIPLTMRISVGMGLATTTVPIAEPRIMSNSAG